VSKAQVSGLVGRALGVKENLGRDIPGKIFILLRLVEMFGEMRRGLTILKMRGSAHDKDMRSYTIDGQGMHLGKPCRNVTGSAGEGQDLRPTQTFHPGTFGLLGLLVILVLLAVRAHRIILRWYPGNVAFINYQDPPAFALRSGIKHDDKGITALGEDVAHPLVSPSSNKHVDTPLDQGAIHHLDGNLASINPAGDDLNTHGQPCYSKGVNVAPAHILTHCSLQVCPRETLLDNETEIT
jgi:hypothetical protein